MCWHIELCDSKGVKKRKRVDLLVCGNENSRSSFENHKYSVREARKQTNKQIDARQTEINKYTERDTQNTTHLKLVSANIKTRQVATRQDKTRLD